MNSYSQTTFKPVKINWEGSLFVHHSLGMVNRELLSELVEDYRLNVGHVAYEPDQFSADSFSKYQDLSKINNKKIENADVYIRHRWPPDFNRPNTSKFI
ncbi:MAG TPA: hypothetical protein VHP36_06690, partial [Chitinispirillaceae bacterium]|nr:hypothetical protein [Chitinispirillaceae bacterium]